MSSINRGKKTTAKVVTEPTDMPGALEEKLKEVLLPKGWVLTSYGIPEKNASLRDRLRKVIKAHGLISIDKIPGSVYFGVREPGLDKALDAVIKQIEKETKMKDLVQLVPGSFEQAQAAFFTDRIVKNLLLDVDEMEEQMDELEKALAGQITLVDPKTQKPRDLVSLGESRIRNARATFAEAESVGARFSGNAALEVAADKVRRRMAQLRTWVDSIEKGYKRFAEVERARRKEA